MKQSLLGYQPLAPNDGLPSPYKGNWVFDEEATRLALIKKAIVDEDPLCVCEKPGWTVILAPTAFPPYFKLPGRTQLTREVLVLYEKMKDELKTYFRTTNQRVSLTTDTWTATNQKINYMVVTAHYIDSDWKLQKRIIGFVQTQSKKGEDLGLLLQTVLREEWGIESVYCITVDNASPNDALAKSLRDATVRWGIALVGGQHMHMRCAAHIINLIVTDGLKEHIKAIKNIRGSIAYVRRSTLRLDAFKDAASKNKVEYKKHLQLDCPTRWNGVYIMLEIALKYKAAFARYELIDKQFEADLIEDGAAVPSNEDWESVERLVEFLKHFYTLTKKVSGSWYMTSNLYLPEICDMYTEINKLLESKDLFVKNIATRMLEKFNKYWGSPEKMNMTLCFAVVLDPRYKFVVLQPILENIYGVDDAQVYLAIIKNEMTELFNEYFERSPFGKKSANPGSSSTFNTAESSSAATSGGSAPRTMELITQQLMKKSMNPENQKTELDRYLSEDPELIAYGAKYDVLNYGKVVSQRFPVLGAMAKDILAVPITSVASESAFSTGGRVLSDYRSSLTPKTVQALICCQDWLYPRGAKKPTLEEDFDKLSIIEA